jgi:mono/diheme cytochrome c family protein
MTQRRVSLFWGALIAFIVIYLILKVGVSYLSMWIVHRDTPLPVPGAVMVIYLALTMIGILVYVSITDEMLQEFLRPIVEVLKGKGWDGWQRSVRAGVLIVFPFLIGWGIYSRFAPSVTTPTSIRIQHPTIPMAYENLQNPFRTAPPESLAASIEEGRILYQINCRPCHGTKAIADGPMARGFRLKPANFADPGTIATVVEAYAFWRVKEGAYGLPPEASPWDSAMPAWKDDLTDDQIWKILMAEYETAGVEPRKPERLEK